MANPQSKVDPKRQGLFKDLSPHILIAAQKHTMMIKAKANGDQFSALFHLLTTYNQILGDLRQFRDSIENFLPGQTMEDRHKDHNNMQISNTRLYQCLIHDRVLENTHISIPIMIVN